MLLFSYPYFVRRPGCLVYARIITPHHFRPFSFASQSSDRFAIIGKVIFLNILSCPRPAFTVCESNLIKVMRHRQPPWLNVPVTLWDPNTLKNHSRIPSRNGIRLNKYTFSVSRPRVFKRHSHRVYSLPFLNSAARLPRVSFYRQQKVSVAASKRRPEAL